MTMPTVRDSVSDHVGDSPGDVVVCDRRLDVTTVGDLREQIHDAVDGGSGPLVIDLGRVEVVDVTGLGLLVGTRHRAARAGRPLQLANVPPRVARVLSATRLDRVLPVHRPGAGRA